MGHTLKKTGLSIYYPSGREFTTLSAASRKVEKTESERELERQRAEKEKQRAEKAESERELEKQRAEKEKQRADMLAAKLKSLGIME